MCFPGVVEVSFRVSFRQPSKNQKILPIFSQSRACAKTSYTLRACASQPGLLSGQLVVASETYKQLEHAAPCEHEGCGFGVVLGIVLSKQYFGGKKCISHSPNDPKRCFRRSKNTFGYGLARRLWRLRVQARSMSSRKESNRWPRMQFTPPE